jgi:hypothetical protein
MRESGLKTVERERESLAPTAAPGVGSDKLPAFSEGRPDPGRGCPVKDGCSSVRAAAESCVLETCESEHKRLKQGAAALSMAVGAAQASCATAPASAKSLLGVGSVKRASAGGHLTPYAHWHGSGVGLRAR